MLLQADCLSVCLFLVVRYRVKTASNYKLHKMSLLLGYLKNFLVLVAEHHNGQVDLRY